MKKFIVVAVSLFSHMANAIADFEEKEAYDLAHDPKYRKYIDSFVEQIKTQEMLPLAEQRRCDDEIAVTQNTCLEVMDRTEDLVILGKDANAIPLRIYYPNSQNDLPVLVFFHGGGWVYGSITRADAICRRFAKHMNCIVVSVDYRLAPENPFPKPLEDCYSATEWAAAYFKGHSISVCGESAGGNLAAAVALLTRDRSGPRLSSQLLINPVITSTIKNEPYEQCQDRYFLTKDLMKYFWNMYLQSPDDYLNPYASPEKASDLSSLPLAIIVTAEFDPLKHEAFSYAEKLKLAGVRVIEKEISHVIHGFISISLYEEEQKVKWTKEIAKVLNK